MSYLFKGRLCGYLCQECLEPLSDVVIRLYRNRKEQNTTALAVADPGLTLSLNNDDQVKAKASGALLSAMGFLSFDPTDPKIMSSNRHPITEAGIGNLIERLEQGYEAEKRLPPAH